MILISACLSGVSCRYNGKSNTISEIETLKHDLIQVCPEQLGNLPTPRPPAEIQNGTGKDVIDMKTAIITKQGLDVTKQFLTGAQRVLELASKHNIAFAIFQERSPSCGVRYCYDGSFSGKLIRGQGITTAMLSQNGFTVFSDEEFTAALKLNNLIDY